MFTVIGISVEKSDSKLWGAAHMLLPKKSWEKNDKSTKTANW